MRAALLWSAADAQLVKLQGLGRGAADGFLRQALRPDEKARLGAAFYNRTRFFQGEQIHLWEARWWQARLPAPPARILVGGAGAGRELLHLARLGYELGGFDPAQAMIQRAKQRLGGQATLLTGNYQRWARGVLGGQDEPLRALAGPWDAILLGWGSLTHVLHQHERQTLLEAAHQACPRGPILMSFWGQGHPGAPRIGRGRLWRAMDQAGRRLGQRRQAQPPEGGEHFIPGLGFGVTLERAQIEALVRPLGRSLVWEADAETYAHATALPPV